MAITPPQINRNLTTGSTGSDVKALQEWLKAQGYFPANQATTETYGPITTKAVAAWQQANNIDTKGNPGSFGPISKAFIANEVEKAAGSSQKGQNATVVTPNTQTGTKVQPTVSTGDMNASLRNLGLSDEQIASIPENQKAVFAGMGDYFTKQYELGPVNAVDLKQAFDAASSDPDIVAKYGDSLKLGVQDFNQTLQSYQSSLTQGMSDEERRFIEDKKKLQEAEAGAGRAYSGFRQQATDRLINDEASIIQSTKSKATDALNKLTSAFESKYGSEALKSAFGSTPISLSIKSPISGTTDTVSATPLGGITGANPMAQKSDILAKQADLLTLNTIK